MTARRNATRVSKVMRQVFGLEELRPGQQAVIDAVLARRHTLAIMPTGAGKSLCYQVPAMLMPGMTVVVSPLIALMRDQFEKLSELGLEAVQVNSAIPTGDIRRARARIGRRTVEFVFTTPSNWRPRTCGSCSLVMRSISSSSTRRTASVNGDMIFDRRISMRSRGCAHLDRRRSWRSRQPRRPT